MHFDQHQLPIRRLYSSDCNNLLHWLPIQQRINFKLATLVHRSLHNARPQYMSSLLNPYTSSRQLCSASLHLFSHASSLLLPLVVFDMLALLFGILSLIISCRSTDSYTIFKSNLKTHLFSGASISGRYQFLSTRFMLIFVSWNYMMCYVLLCYVYDYER